MQYYGEEKKEDGIQEQHDERRDVYSYREENR